MKKERYTIKKNGIEIGKVSTIKDVSHFIGCSYAHIYKYIIDGKLTFKKIKYEIIDKLDA